MRVEIRSQGTPSGWNAELLSRPGEGRYEQSTSWAEILRALDGSMPIYLRVTEAERTVASLLCFQAALWNPYKDRVNRNPVHWLSGRSRGSLRWLWGPTFFGEDEAENREALKLILENVEQIGREQKVFELRGYITPSRDATLVGMIGEEFVRLGYQQERGATLLVDLGVDEEQLWRTLKSSGRKAVNKARRQGVHVEEISSDKGFDEVWHASYEAFELAAGRRVYGKQWFRRVWERGYPDTHRYYVARAEDKEPLAVLGMTVFNTVAREFNSAMSPRAFTEGIPAQDILHWEMFLEAKALGCSVFDLAGVDPDRKNGKARGIRQFKEKWGGEYVEYQRYHKGLRTGWF